MIPDDHLLALHALILEPGFVDQWALVRHVVDANRYFDQEVGIRYHHVGNIGRSLKCRVLNLF